MVLGNLFRKRFGTRVVISPAYGYNDRGQVCWLVRCDWGGLNLISANVLKKRHTCQSCSWKNSRLSRGEACFNKLFTAYKSGAARRDIIFSLTPEDFKRITSSDCIFCGKDPVQKSIHTSRSITPAGQLNATYLYNG